MGAVLALGAFMRTAVLLAAGLLAGCAEEDRRPVTLDAIAVARARLTPPDPDAPTLRDTLTRDRIEASEKPLFFVELPKRGAQSALVPVLGSPRGVTWGTPDGITVTLDDGLVIATRGLGGDLMAVDTGALRQALASGGQVQRMHDYLNGNDQIERSVYECRVSVGGSERIAIFGRSYDVRRVTEACTGGDPDRVGGGAFTNLYWVDAQGTIWKSRQWISQFVGYMETETL